MIDLLKPFQPLIKLKSVCTDNNIFRLHYKLTVLMLLIFTILITSKQFFGDPIYCMGDDEGDNKDAINAYCWIYGTYTLKSKLLGVEGKHNIYAGVGPHTNDYDDQIKHTYYQWVCFVLLGQAVMFYIPHYLWKGWEGGRLQELVSDLAGPMVPKDWLEFRRQQLIIYLSYTKLNVHKMYALHYAFCELLNLVNVVGQIFLLDKFLGGAFRNYGAAVAAFTYVPKVPSLDNSNVNPMDQFFPKLTKCWYRNYGPSGSIQLKDKLCVLSLNIVNEKIFVILWFWLIFLLVLSALAVFFRILVFSTPSLRTYLLMTHLRHMKRSVVSRIVKNFGVGDWFVLNMLGKNMNPILYKDLIGELSKELQEKLHV